MGLLLANGRASAQTASAVPSKPAAGEHTLRELRAHQTELTRLIASLRASRKGLLVQAAEARATVSWFGSNMADGPEEFASEKAAVLAHEEGIIQSLRAEIVEAAAELAAARESAREQRAMRSRYAAELAQWRSGRTARPWAVSDNPPEAPIGLDLEAGKADDEAVALSEKRIRSLRQNLAWHRDVRSYWRGATFESLCSTVGDGLPRMMRRKNALAAKLSLLDGAIASLEEQDQLNRGAMLRAVSADEVAPKKDAGDFDAELRACAQSRSSFEKDLAEARKEKEPAVREKAIAAAIDAFVRSGMPVDLASAIRFSATVRSSIQSLGASESPVVNDKRYAYLAHPR